MNKQRSKILFLFAAAAFLVIIPVITMLFSRFGLERYKQVKGELYLLKDSTLVRKRVAPTNNGNVLSEKFISDKALLIQFVNNTTSSPALQRTLQGLSQLQKSLPVESPNKWLILTYVKADSSNNLSVFTSTLSRDTSTWKILSLPAEDWETAVAEHRLPKDSTDYYFNLVDAKGYLCNRYNPADEAFFAKIAQHIAIIIPKQERKKIEYKADKDLYK
jgi:hypothetical protein